MIGLDDVLAARRTIGDRLHRTPTLTSRSLSERVGARALLKAELFQKTGSFKPRGVLTKLATLTAEERTRGVIGISAGNHAQALAFGAALEGLDALVVMWEGANPAKIAGTRGYGAEVDLSSAGPREAFERLAELQAAYGRTLVHPFDDPLVCAGQGTVGLELLEDAGGRVDVVVCPVGGGGLLSGVATAVKGASPRSRVVAVEPEGASTLHHAVATGDNPTITPTSIADGLNAPFAGGIAIEVARARVDDVVLVTDAEIERGLRFLYARAKLACEPAGAAATAALLAGSVQVAPDETVVAIVSGGNADPKMASAILARADED